MMKILFVCTGNTCRSPMAQYLTRALSNRFGAVGVEADSCGLRVSPGAVMNETAREVLREIGIDAPPRPARAWSDCDRDADCIVTMTAAHKSRLPYPNVFTIGELTDGAEIEDPFAGEIASYRKTRDRLMAGLEVLLKKIANLSPESSCTKDT